MQKLKFINSKGIEIDFTSGNYGITEWNGLSENELNIQTQQVPFNDGSIFLDALLESRDLNFTLAINDDCDLEKRYRIKREVISTLNPKLGVGTLIYENDFTCKQIRCISQLPVFTTKNQNNGGTLKASLSFFAPSPYWEDLNETLIILPVNSRENVINSGDVETSVKISLLTDNITNPKIKNLTNDMILELNGNFSNNIQINTDKGNKTIKSIKEKLIISKLNATVNDIVYIDKFFFIVGDYGLIVKSNDGVNWSFSQSNISENLNSITYSESLNLFVAVGNRGKIITSDDGVNWIERNSGTTDNLNCVTYSESLNLFLVGGSSNYNNLFTSNDGINWITRSPDIGTRINQIKDINGVIYILGNLGTLAKSNNGVNWSQIPLGTNNHLKSISYSQKLNKFVIVGVGYSISTLCEIYTSSNGINWTENQTHSNNYHVEYNEILNKFIAVGTSVLTSTDGENWIKTSINYQIIKIAYSKDLNLFMGISNSSKTFGYNPICKSNNGVNWEFKIELMNALNSITYSESLNLFVAVGNRGKIITSDDGVNWIERNSGTTDSLDCVTYSESLNLFLVGGSNYSNRSFLLKSNDGVNWNPTFIKNERSTIRNIIFNKSLNLFVAVGNKSNSDFILTSNDGVNWIERSKGVINYDLYSIACNKQGKFVAVGKINGHSPEYELILTSNDGVNWNIISSRQQAYILNSITYSESLNLFVAVGNRGKIITSDDGVNWIERNSGTTDNLNCVRFLKNRLKFYITGVSQIISSSDGINWEKFYLNGDYKDFTEKDLNLYVTGTNYIISSFEFGENLIDKLNENSNMNFHLKKDSNLLIFNCDEGTGLATISFRNKYIGV